MSGFFGVVSKQECLTDLFYGTDYHSHLGARRGGMAVHGKQGFQRYIHDISSALFRSKFHSDVTRMSGNKGIGVISDYDDQPLVVSSRLGTYGIVTVGNLANMPELIEHSYHDHQVHFSHMNDGQVNPTELIASLINQRSSFAEGIRFAQEMIAGSCSMLLLTADAVYAARDRFGRTPVVIGSKPDSFAATLESCALPNLEYSHTRDLGPGEIVRLTENGVETLRPADDELHICAFLWIYYGFPASTYEGINVEESRYRSGAKLAKRDQISVDFVTGVPDSGTGHGLGYAHAACLPFKRPFIKYTPTWSRSFIPPVQAMREKVAKMKLIPIPEMIRGQRLLFCDDSIVRGTQLRDTTSMLYHYGAREVHVRVACPPILFGCPYLNFSRSHSPLELAGRRAIFEITGKSDDQTAQQFADPDAPQYEAMVNSMTRKLGLTSLRFQRLDDLITAIGLPKSSLCTHCWDGEDRSGACATCPARTSNVEDQP